MATAELLPLPATFIATVSTGLEGVAQSEAADKLGHSAVAPTRPREGRVRLTLASRRQLGRLFDVRCLGQLVLVVHEDAAFFGGRGADGADADLARLRELGFSSDWVNAAALRAAALEARDGGGARDREGGAGRAKGADDAPRPVRFRVTCKRTTAVDGRDTGDVAHGFTSVAAAAQLGGAIARAAGWEVSLKAFDVDVLLLVAGRELVVGLKVGDGGRERAGSRAGLMLGRTALRTAMAHALNRLALGGGRGGEDRDEGEDGDGDTNVGSGEDEGGDRGTGGWGWGLTVDPCCGGGCIGLEGATCWPGSYALGGDFTRKEVERFGSNLAAIDRHRRRAEGAGGGSAIEGGGEAGEGGGTKRGGAKRGVDATGRGAEGEAEEGWGRRSATTDAAYAAVGRCDAIQWDAARLPLRSGSVDNIATDLPWGHTVGSKSAALHGRENIIMYRQALREWGRVLRPGGMCVFLTADRKSMRAALRGELFGQEGAGEGAGRGADKKAEEGGKRQGGMGRVQGKEVRKQAAKGGAAAGGAAGGAVGKATKKAGGREGKKRRRVEEQEELVETGDMDTTIWARRALKSGDGGAGRAGGAGGAGGADEAGGAGSVGRGRGAAAATLEAARTTVASLLDPDHFVNVSGKRAGIWCLRRSALPWKSAIVRERNEGGGEAGGRPNKHD